MGRPTASARTLGAVLMPRLETLPGPVGALRLRALGLGPPVGASSSSRSTVTSTVVPLDSASRFPERWAMLTPSPDR